MQFKYTASDIEELVFKAQNGDDIALNEIIQSYKWFIIKEAGKYRIPSYDFEDIVQHGYLTIVKCIRLYKASKSGFHPYVIRAVKNNFGDLLRRKIKHFREVPDENIMNHDEVYDFTIEDQLIAYEQVKELYEVLDKLSGVERSLIEDHYLKGKSLKKIAEESGYSYSGINKKKNNILKKLQKQLKGIKN